MLVFETAEKFYGLNKYVRISRFSTDLENTLVAGFFFELMTLYKDKKIVWYAPEQSSAPM